MSMISSQSSDVYNCSNYLVRYPYTPANLGEGIREDRARFSSKVHSERTKANRHKLQQGVVQIDTRTTLFTGWLNPGTGSLERLCNLCP